MGDVLQQFECTRLHDVAQDLFGKSARFVASDWNDIDHFLPLFVVQEKAGDTAVFLFDLVRILNGDAKSDGKIFCKMKPAEREHCGMLNCAASEDHQTCDLGANIDDRATILFIVVGEGALSSR